MMEELEEEKYPQNLLAANLSFLLVIDISNQNFSI